MYFDMHFEHCVEFMSLYDGEYKQLLIDKGAEYTFALHLGIKTVSLELCPTQMSPAKLDENRTRKEK